MTGPLIPKCPHGLPINAHCSHCAPIPTKGGYPAGSKPASEIKPPPPTVTSQRRDRAERDRQRRNTVDLAHAPTEMENLDTGSHCHKPGSGIRSGYLGELYDSGIRHEWRDRRLRSTVDAAEPSTEIHRLGTVSPVARLYRDGRVVHLGKPPVLLHSPDWEPDVVFRNPPHRCSGSWEWACGCGHGMWYFDAAEDARGAFLRHKYGLDPLPQVVKHRRNPVWEGAKAALTNPWVAVSVLVVMAFVFAWLV